MAYPIYQQNFQPSMAPQQVMQQQMNTPQFIQQSNNIVSVASEEIARNYPVAPGNLVIFKDENQPCIYLKSMGFSQLDRPVFERYIRDTPNEEVTPQQNSQIDLSEYALKTDLESALEEIKSLKDEIKRTTRQSRYTKKEVNHE